MIIADAVKSLKNYTRHDGEVGLELETETIDHYNIPEMVYWSSHEDRSLRDVGIEYVLKAPVKVKDQLPDALNEFQSKTKNINFKHDPVTASCHIHVNMLNENWLTFSNFLALYVMFENLLIRYSGPNRLSNLFCLPVIDAEATANNIKTMIKAIDQKNYRALYQMSEQHCKYAALNLAAFSRLGSLEVRSFRGATDINEIKEWVDIIYSILEFSRQSINPVQILEEFKTKGLSFGAEVFNNNWKKLLLEKEVTESLVKKNLWYVQDSIAYIVSDWNTINEGPKPKKVPDAAVLNKMAHALFSSDFSSLSSAKQEYVYTIAVEKINEEKKISAYELTRDWTTAQATPRAIPRTLRGSPLDLIRVYRPSIDERIDILRGDQEEEDEFIETIERGE